MEVFTEKNKNPGCVMGAVCSKKDGKRRSGVDAATDPANSQPHQVAAVPEAALEKKQRPLPDSRNVAQGFAIHLDLYLTSGARSETDDEVIKAVEASLQLCAGALTELYVFENVYTSLLAQRLLQGKTRDCALERSAVEKMSRCGLLCRQAARRLTAMIVDATQWNREHQDECNGNPATTSNEAPVSEGGFFSAQVVTKWCWSSCASLDISLPMSMQQCVDRFASSYVKRHRGRKLEWLPTLSSCTIVAHFKGSCEIAMSLPQGLVMLLFNDCSSISFGEICKKLSSSGRMQVDPDSAEMVNQILGIACAEMCLLRRSDGASNRNVIDKTETLSVNHEFDVTHNKTTVSTRKLSSLSSGSEGTTAIAEFAAFAERVFVVDNIVVAYMRARRRVDVQDLIKDVLALLKFPASATEVRKRIDTLVTRDVLRLDGSANNGALLSVVYVQ